MIDIGADEAVSDQPIDRLGRSEILEAGLRSVSVGGETTLDQIEAASLSGGGDVEEAARAQMLHPALSLLSELKTVQQLREAVESYELCALKRTATKTVFSDGNPNADVMLVGEAPGADEDRVGLPFVGVAGELLDRMLASIGLDRTSVYITNLLFWRPPGNRNPTEEEIGQCLPFVERHISLVNPSVLVLVGGISAKTLLRKTEGITRLRGNWFEYEPLGSDRKIATTCIFHPAFLLRQPKNKRATWQDLIAIRDRLSTLPRR